MRFYCATSTPKKASTFLVGVPYDGTSTFRPGSRFAPSSIREASYGIESYSPYLKKDLRDKRICDMGDIPLSFGDKQLNMKIVSRFFGGIIKRSKKFVAIGGEHLISYPVVSQLKERFSDLVVVQLDAHSDLADTYRGEKLSHATVMRRIAELVGFENLYQLGIRSMTRFDMLLPLRDRNLCMFDFSKAEEFAERIGDKPVYLSVDLDVLDPSVLPGTGTPEPGGVLFQDLIALFKLFSKLRIVAADVVELSPHYDPTGVSSVTAAVVVRELLLLL